MKSLRGKPIGRAKRALAGVLLAASGMAFLPLSGLEAAHSECKAHEHLENHGDAVVPHEAMVHVGSERMVQAQPESECPHCPVQNCAFQPACAPAATVTAEVVESSVPYLGLGDRALVYAPTVVLYSVAEQRSTPPPR